MLLSFSTSESKHGSETVTTMMYNIAAPLLSPGHLMLVVAAANADEKIMAGFTV